MGPKEAAKYSQFKEEERQRGNQAAQIAQPVGGKLEEPKGKPNTLVQRKKKGPYKLQESSNSRFGASKSSLQVWVPMVQDISRYWDSLGAFYNPWVGVYLKGYYYPSVGQMSYRANVPKDALKKIPQALQPNFEAHQEALKIYVPSVEDAAKELYAIQRHGKCVPEDPHPIPIPGIPGARQGQPSRQGPIFPPAKALPFMMGGAIQ